MSNLAPQLRKLVRRNKRSLVQRAGARQGQEMVTDEKRIKAYRMLLEEGKSRKTIGQEMGVTPQTVDNWLNHEYEKTKIAISQCANLMRERMTRRVEEIIEFHMPLATGPTSTKEDAELTVKHAGVVLSAVEKMAKLYGSDKVSVIAEKGATINLPTNVFVAVRQLADKLQTANVIAPEVIEGEFSKKETEL